MPLSDDGSAVDTPETPGDSIAVVNDGTRKHQKMVPEFETASGTLQVVGAGHGLPVDAGDPDLGNPASTPFASDDSWNTAAGLPSLPADATQAIVQVEGGTVRWRPDGSTTAPTGAVGDGQLLTDGSTVVFGKGHTTLAAIRLIKASGTPTVTAVYVQ